MKKLKKPAIIKILKDFRNFKIHVPPQLNLLDQKEQSPQQIMKQKYF